MKTRKIKKPLKGMKIVKNGVETRISKVIDAISFEIEMSPYRVFGIHEFEEVEQLVILDEKPHYVWQEDLDHLNVSKMNKKNRDSKDLSATAIRMIKNRKPEDLTLKKIDELKYSRYRLSERSKVIELLEKYSMWLTKHGYMDTDWKDEPPFAIDEFLNSNETNK